MAIDMGPPPAGGTHGVVVIHGIGEPSKGETLAAVVNPIAEYLVEHGAAVRQAMEVTGGDAAEAVLDFAPPAGGGGKPQRWLFREAYWAPVFQPPTLKALFIWGLLHAGRQIRGIFNGLQDVANEQPDKGDPSIAYECAPVLATERRAHSFAARGLAEANADGIQVVKLPRLRQAAGTKAVKEAQISVGRVTKGGMTVMGLVMALASPVAAVLATAALMLGWFLLWLPALPGLPNLGRWLSTTMDAFFVRGLGDAYRFVEHTAWASAIRRVLEREVERLLDDKDVADVTIIAHSLGATVAYDALQANGMLGAFIAAQRGRRKKRITFVSVGAGLNRTWRLAKGAPVPGALRRFLRPVDREIAAPLPTKPDDVASGFRWVYLYARYDPVPAGPLDAEVWCSSGLDPMQLKHRRVINQDNPFSDHTTYWENRRLVAPRLAHAISGALPWPGLDLPKDWDGWGVSRQTTGTLALTAARGAIIALAGAHLIAMMVNGWWWAHVRDVTLALPKLKPVIQWFDHPLGLGLNLQAQVLWLLVAALTVAVAISLYRAISGLRQVLDDRARAARVNPL
ncbi:MAG: hypothetical protein HY330_04065 [Chloroflexi bacterium]|nr:hypothetical protein [Chloroflexota bacterium]